MKDLVDNWIKFQSLPRDSEEAELFEWAEEEAALLSITSPDDGWQFIVEVLEKNQDEWILMNIAAGPLDNLLSFFPNKTMFLMRKDVPGNAKLERALRRIWKSLIPDTIWGELRYLQAS